MNIWGVIGLTLSIGLLLASLIGLCVTTYIWRRNDRVYDFRTKILDGITPANWKEAKEIYEKYSYDDMLNSIKPLKLEAWFTEEEIRILKGETDGN